MSLQAFQAFGPEEQLRVAREHQAVLRSDWQLANARPESTKDPCPDRDIRRPGSVKRIRLVLGRAIVGAGRAVGGPEHAEADA